MTPAMIERRQRIVEFLKTSVFYSTGEVAAHLDEQKSAVRSTLKRMASDGIVGVRTVMVFNCPHSVWFVPEKSETNTCTVF